MAEAIAGVQAQYGLTLDPKTQAWLQLLGTAGTIYGSRIGVMMALRAAERARAKERAARVDDYENRVDEVLEPDVPVSVTNGVPANGDGRFASRPGFGSVGAVSHPQQMYPPGHRGAHS